MRPQPITHTIIEGFYKQADEAAATAHAHRRASQWFGLGVTVLMAIIMVTLAMVR